MSHANAALTPKARLRLAKLIVEDGWKPSAAAKMFMVSTVTARKWAARFRAEGPAGMADRSSRPQLAARTRRSRAAQAADHELRWRHRLGPVQIGGRLGMAPSTVHAVLVRCRVNRLSHIDRVTGEPIRRYEHPHPGSLIHVDVTKFGNIPDGGGHRFLSRQRRQTNAQAQPADRERGKHYRPADRHRLRAHRGRRPLSSRLRRDLRRREVRRPPSESCSEPSPGSPNAASPSNESSPTTAAVTAPTPGATPAPTSASHTSAPGPTGPRPTARSSGSTAPWPTVGPTPASTAQKTERRAALPGWIHFYNHHRIHSAIGGTPISRLNNLPGHHTSAAGRSPSPTSRSRSPPAGTTRSRAHRLGRLARRDVPPPPPSTTSCDVAELGAGQPGEVGRALDGVGVRRLAGRDQPQPLGRPPPARRPRPASRSPTASASAVSRRTGGLDVGAADHQRVAGLEAGRPAAAGRGRARSGATSSRPAPAW